MQKLQEYIYLILSIILLILFSVTLYLSLSNQNCPPCKTISDCLPGIDITECNLNESCDSTPICTNCNTQAVCGFDFCNSLYPCTYTCKMVALVGNENQGTNGKGEVSNLDATLETFKAYNISPYGIVTFIKEGEEAPVSFIQNSITYTGLLQNEGKYIIFTPTDTNSFMPETLTTGTYFCLV